MIFMLRRTRIDASGALHLINAWGIGRRKIFNDDQDRENFIERLETISEYTMAGCYACELTPNSFSLIPIRFPHQSIFSHFVVNQLP
jgi:putative transposase